MNIFERPSKIRENYWLKLLKGTELQRLAPW